MKEQKQDHIDVKNAIKQLWMRRKTFIWVWAITIVAVGAGTYLIPKKWKSSMKIVPEYNLQEAYALQQLFEEMKTGMHLSPMGDAIAPILYADVIADGDFLQELSSKTVVDQKGRTYPIAYLYEEAKTKEEMHSQMRTNISCKMARKDESVTLSVVAHDPVVAKQMVELVSQQLSERISTYRHEKAQRNLDHYAQLAKNGEVAATMYEVAKVQLEEHQPPFVVVQQAEVPYKKESPKRVPIVMVSWLLVTLGLVIWYWRKDLQDWL